MEKYDLLFILLPTLSEEEMNQVQSSVRDLITGNGGALTKETNLGKNKLAYKIKQQKYGVYINMFFTLEKAKIGTVENALRLENNVLRHLIIKGEPIVYEIRTEEKFETQEEQPAGPSLPTPPEQKKEEPIKETIIEKKESAEEKPVKEDKRATLEELDEKLDKILSDDIIK